MNILEQMLEHAGLSIASGFTWDLIKVSGAHILKGFKDRFIKNKVFENEAQCEEFMKEVLNASSNTTSTSLKGVDSIYKELTGEAEFYDEFEKWVRENKEEFKKLMRPNQIGSFQIQNQSNTGSGSIINAGIWNGDMRK